MPEHTRSNESAALLPASNDLLGSDSVEDKSTRTWQTAAIAFTASIGYIITYFVRYPLFVIPGVDHGYLGVLPVKTWFSIASTGGYALSKIPAYKLVSTFGRARRLYWLLGLILLQLVFTVGGFAVLPAWAQTLGIFLGSFPGSWVYVVLFQYLEGRTTTEFIASMLSLALVCAGSLSRTIGSAMLDGGVPANWMPLVVAACMLPLSIVSLVVLDKLPDPSQVDTGARSERRPVGAEGRGKFMKQYWPGILLLVINYTVIVTYRSFRDFFAPDIYTSLLGKSPQPSLYLLADWPGGITSCLMMATVVKVRNSRRAVLALHGISILGAIILGLGVIVHEIMDEKDPELFIAWAGVGFFILWGPIGALMFERLIAASGTAGTSVFLIPLADGCGYVGSIGLLLYHGLAFDEKGKSAPKADLLGQYFVYASGALAVVVGALGIVSALYFKMVLKPQINQKPSGTSLNS